MVIGIIIGIIIGAALGIIVGGMLAGADQADERAEYALAVEDLGKALREAYAFIHVMGEWDEFESTGFTVDPPAPTAISDGERREIRAARARARHRGMTRQQMEDREAWWRGSGARIPDAPRGHTRVGIDHPRRTE